MNANSTHLDLEDLIAGVTGQAVGEHAREHLAGCEQCQLEANRWSLVADGVRDLAAEAAEVPEPARPPRTGRRVLAGPWRRAAVIVGSVAASLVLLVAIGIAAGLVHVHLSGPGSGSGSETTLTSVSGCARLQQANGRLERVNGADVVIKTASGQLVTVTTTASTLVSMSGPLRRDITDGASVMVRGPRSGGTVTAAIVTVGRAFSTAASAGFVLVKGTVSDASSAGFTVITSSGTRVPVTTSGETMVVVPHARLGQLKHGTTIFALGPAGPDGTLSARAVAAVSQLPPGLPVGVHGPAGAHTHISVHMHAGAHVGNCSPGAIAAALMPGG